MLDTLNRTRDRIQSLKVTARMTLMPKQERILQILVQSPRVGGGELARSLGITRSHLSKILRPLSAAGLIVKEGATKSAAYRLK